MTGAGNEKIRRSYDELKIHRTCLEEMIAELDFKIKELLARAKEFENDKPVTVRNCLLAAERYRKRLNALKASLALADAELLRLLEILS